MTVAVLAGAIVAGWLVYRIRNVLLLILIAGFMALILNPFVVLLERGLRRRTLAVAVTVILAAVAFLGLAAAFGYPLSDGLAHLARRVPSEVAAAEQGRGVIGQLVQRFHIQQWVQTNAPKLEQLGANLAKPALAVGKAAALLVGEILAVLTLVVLFLLEGPRIRTGLLGVLAPDRAAWVSRVGTEMRQAAVGYVFGDLLTSVIAGVVVGGTMAGLGLPFPFLWALWVALVDFLPQVGGALAGIPTILFAAVQSLTAAAILGGVFIAYQQIENHVLNPMIMSRTVRTSPLVIFIAVLVGASIGAAIGGIVGAFFGALLAVPAAACVQILARELWQITAPHGSDESRSPPGESPSAAPTPGGVDEPDRAAPRHPTGPRRQAAAWVRWAQAVCSS